MTNLSVAEQRYIENAVLIAARQLSINALIQHFGSYPLKTVVIIHNGQGLKKSERDLNGGIPVYAAGGEVGFHTEGLSAESFVVIGRKGSAGKATFAPNGGWVIDTAYYAQPKDSNKIDCKFL